MSSPSRVRLSGPLVGYAVGFRADLEAQGYRRNVVANQLQLFAHVSRWLESKGLGPQHLTGERVAEFLSARRSAGYTLWLSEKGVAPLLTYLRSVGAAPATEASRWRRLIVCSRSSGSIWSMSAGWRRARSLLMSMSPGCSSRPEGMLISAWRRSRRRTLLRS